MSNPPLPPEKIILSFILRVLMICYFLKERTELNVLKSHTEIVPFEAVIKRLYYCDITVDLTKPGNLFNSNSNLNLFKSQILTLLFAALTKVEPNTSK